MKLVGSVLLCATWSLFVACGRPPENFNKPPATPSPSPSPAASINPALRAQAAKYPNLLAQAQEVNDAFRRRDFGRMVDLTYPKVIEMAGGRDKMIASLTKGLQDMEAEGVSVLESTAAAPSQILEAAGSVYAVVPTTLTVKAKDGIFRTDSSMIGISNDKGAHWTFIDAGGKDHNQLKKLLPVVDNLNLPADKEPVKISGN
jgi:hypothetical protein